MITPGRDNYEYGHTGKQYIGDLRPDAPPSKVSVWESRFNPATGQYEKQGSPKLKPATFFEEIIQNHKRERA